MLEPANRHDSYVSSGDLENTLKSSAEIHKEQERWRQEVQVLIEQLISRK